MKSRRAVTAAIPCTGMHPTRQPSRTLAMFLRSGPDIWDKANIPCLNGRRPKAGGSARI